MVSQSNTNPAFFHSETLFFDYYFPILNILSTGSCAGSWSNPVVPYSKYMCGAILLRLIHLPFLHSPTYFTDIKKVKCLKNLFKCPFSFIYNSITSIKKNMLCFQTLGLLKMYEVFFFMLSYIWLSYNPIYAYLDKRKRM